MSTIGGDKAEANMSGEPAVGFGRERRLHARAYQRWSSLLKGRRVPALVDLDPADLADFADNGVLIELRGSGAPRDGAASGASASGESQAGFVAGGVPPRAASSRFRPWVDSASDPMPDPVTGTPASPAVTPTAGAPSPSSTASLPSTLPSASASASTSAALSPAPTPSPTIAFLGRALRDQAAIAPVRPELDEIPPESLLGAMLTRLPAAISSGVPVGFEAELPDRDAARLLHRGILLPFAGDDGAIVALLGVVSWKRVAARVGPDIVDAVESSHALRPARLAARPWGDGPSAAVFDQQTPAPLPLAQRLATARTWAALAATDQGRNGTAIHAALSATYDMLIAARESAAAFGAIADQAGVPRGAPAQMAIALTFAAADDATRDAYAAVLAHAERLGIGPRRLADTLDRWQGRWEAFAAAHDSPRSRAGSGDDAEFETIEPESEFIRGHRRTAADALARRSA